MKVIVAGGTGFLGGALVARLQTDGHEIRILTRQPRGGGHIAWTPDGTAGAWARELDGADAVINLAGESIAAGRWSAARKRRILDSRVQATRSLARAIAASARPPAVFASSSGVGYYGSRGDERLTEESSSGSDFLASVCREWEAEALAASTATRVVMLRTGLVLDATGGALPRIALPFRLFAGGPVGSGRHYWPWVHREDWVEMVRWALATPSVTGALNITAPEPVTNREFSRVLARVLRRPGFMPAPSVALRLALGEMADALLLGSQRAVPEKATRSGYSFRHRALEPALRSLFA